MRAAVAIIATQQQGAGSAREQVGAIRAVRSRSRDQADALGPLPDVRVRELQ
jgi:hypothetical protein